MSAPLYTIDILRLAAATAEIAPLQDAQTSAEKRSPVCGSRVRVDLVLDESGQVAKMGGAIHACALGQASAALLAAHIVGAEHAEIAEARDRLRSYLTGEAPTPGDWPGLEAFAAARQHPGRHAAILLAFEAAAEAAASVTVRG